MAAGSSTNTCNKTLYGSPGLSGTSGTVGVGAGVQSNADATKTPSPTRGIRGSFVWIYYLLFHLKRAFQQGMI